MQKAYRGLGRGMGFHGLLPGTASLQPLGRLPGGREVAEVFAAFLRPTSLGVQMLGNNRKLTSEEAKPILLEGNCLFLILWENVNI